MRKYILSKKEMTDLVGRSGSLEGAQHDGHATGVEQPPEVHPPLPLEPPPVHRPMPIIKQEIVDTEYPNVEESSNVAFKDFQINVAPQTEVDKSQTICRDFVRGTCKRSNTCKFAHKYDLNQLTGVYTFCHKYQNTYCTFTNCKFVHASVFEEQEFYRTGILPPHALAHHKKPSPDAQPPLEESQPENVSSPLMPISNPLPPISNPMPPILNEIEKPTLSPIPANVTAAPMPLKRPWAAMELFGNSSGDSIKFPAKKCQDCDTLEFRLSYNEEKRNTCLQAKIELMRKIAHLNEKSSKLDAIMSMLKPQGSSMGNRLRALMSSNLFNSL